MDNIEFIDCSSISIQYDATGLATLSFVVLRNNTTPMTSLDLEKYSSVCFGFVKFIGVLMSVTQKPIIGSFNEFTNEMWVEWQFNLRATGNRSNTSPSDWGPC
jgi:hypothetical protein